MIENLIAISLEAQENYVKLKKPKFKDEKEKTANLAYVFLGGAIKKVAGDYSVDPDKISDEILSQALGKARYAITQNRKGQEDLLLPVDEVLEGLQNKLREKRAKR